jgi:polyhydroxyalkanoate synthesis regulator protein
MAVLVLEPLLRGLKRIIKSCNKGVNMKNIIKYSNRKLYDKELSRYVTIEEILTFPLGSFRVITHKTFVDVTTATLLSGLIKVGVNPKVKIGVMQHIIVELSR